MSERRGAWVMMMGETEVRNVQDGKEEIGVGIDESAIGSRSCCAEERLT